jgi:CCR4-NOT transcription complex subunit 1
VVVICSILRARILSVEEYDLQLARYLETARPQLMEYIVNVIRQCVLGANQFAHYTDFLHSIAAMSQLISRGKGDSSIQNLLEELNKKHASYLVYKDVLSKDPSTVESTLLKERLEALFTEWVKIFYHPASSEKMQASFVAEASI